MSKMLAIVAASLIAVGVIIGGIGLWRFPSGAALSEREHVYREFDVSGIQDIDVRCSWHNVEVRAIAGDRVALSYMDGGEWTVEERGGVLIVGAKDPVWSIFNIFRSRGDSTLWIGVPADFAGNVRIRTASGNVALDAGAALTAGELGDAEAAGGFSPMRNVELASASGRVSARGLAVDGLSAKSTSGRVEVADIRAGSVNAASTSGNVSLTDVSADEIGAHSVSGNIALSAAAPKNALEATSTSGSIRGSVSAREDDTSISASSTSGKVKVPRGVDGGTVTLRLKTVSGNIDVSLQ